jgi:predicted molibdopterin-dependent oxidoreductase YjgC
MIVAQLAKELGLDWGYELSASAVFREIGEQVPAYAGMRYPLLKDESKPVQAKHVLNGAHGAGANGSASALSELRTHVEALEATGEKITVTPDVGTELFRLGRLTEKVPQFQLLANGNPRPETTAVSPLYQIGRKIADFQLPIAD